MLGLEKQTPPTHRDEQSIVARRTHCQTVSLSSAINIKQRTRSSTEILRAQLSTPFQTISTKHLQTDNNTMSSGGSNGTGRGGSSGSGGSSSGWNPILSHGSAIGILKPNVVFDVYGSSSVGAFVLRQRLGLHRPPAESIFLCLTNLALYSPPVAPLPLPPAVAAAAVVARRLPDREAGDKRMAAGYSSFDGADQLVHGTACARLEGTGA